MLQEMSDRCYKRWIRKELKERWMVQGTIVGAIEGASNDAIGRSGGN